MPFAISSKLLRIFFFLLSLALFQAQSQNEIRTVGGPNLPYYQSLTQAFQDITANPLLNDVDLVLASGYLSSSETFPLQLPNASMTAGHGIRIYPAVSGLSILAASATGIININGSANVILDGRVNGTGNNRDLVIENDGNGYAIQISNGANHNSVKHCILRGSNAANTTPGVVNFSASTASTGATYNLVDSCDITNGINYPRTAVYAVGASGKINNHNTISHCNIYNFRSASSGSYGIFIDNYNENWDILGNCFFQTSLPLYTASASISVINLSTYGTSGSGFLVSGNKIGGSAPDCAGSPYAFVNNNNPPEFNGIRILIANTAYSTISNNVIQNISCSSDFMGIRIDQAKYLKVLNNTIGDSVGNASIKLYKPVFHDDTPSGIHANSNYTQVPETKWIIDGNTIGSITAMPGAALDFTAISTAWGDSAIIRNNLIGSRTTPNSIYLNTGDTNHKQSLTGIYIEGFQLLIQDNTIANITNNNTAVRKSLTRGIFGIWHPNCKISGNTIRDLSTACSYPFLALAGIDINYSQLIFTNNTVSRLSCTSQSAAAKTEIRGISCNITTGTVYPNELSGNLVHSLQHTNLLNSGDITGIYLQGGQFLITNNMISLGSSLNGATFPNGCNIVGLLDVAGTNTYYNNSFHVGGTELLAIAPYETAAFKCTDLVNAKIFKNNIFDNTRLSSYPGIINYAAKHAKVTGMIADYNIYHVTDSLAVAFFDGDTAWNDLQPLRERMALQEIHSAIGDPGFASPDGNPGNPDLHLGPISAAEGSGTSLAAVTQDIDGQNRATTGSRDIGADEGNSAIFDIFPPEINIIYLLPTSNTTNRSLEAVIKDIGLGLPVNQNYAPRLYYRRSLPSTSAWTSTQGLLQSGDLHLGKWSFPLDYTQLGQGYTAAMGDTYQYYIVAQDAASPPHVWMQPFVHAIHSSVYAQFAAPESPLTFQITSGLHDTILVGPGQALTSLSNAGGLFQAIGTGLITGNMVALITGNTAENSNYKLNKWTLEGAQNYSLRIGVHDTTTLVKNMLFNGSGQALTFNAVDMLTIDGSANGQGQFLRFKHDASNHEAVLFQNGANNNLLTHCIFESSCSVDYGGIIYFGNTNNAKGNSNNTILENTIRCTSLGTVAVQSRGTAAYPNRNNSLINNNIQNFLQWGVLLFSGTGNGWIISGNSFSNTNTFFTSNEQRMIDIRTGSDHLISGNYFGGMAPKCQGAAWINSGLSTYVTCIYLYSDVNGHFSIQGNKIANIRLSASNASYTTVFRGIYVVQGSAEIGNIEGNLIGGYAATDSIVLKGNQQFTGIQVNATAAIKPFVIKNNTICRVKAGFQGNNILMRGIQFMSTLNYDTTKIEISGNTITDLSAATTLLTTGNASLAGINVNCNASNLQISGNRVDSLQLITNGTYTLSAAGIFLKNAASGSIIGENRLANFSSKTTSSAMNGILVDGNALIKNNFISMENKLLNTAVNLYGIHEINAGLAQDVLFNSVFVSGNSLAVPATVSYCIWNEQTATSQLRNNILLNTRNSGNPNNYALGIATNACYSGDHNVFHSGSNPIGKINGQLIDSLDDWQATTNQDMNSSIFSPVFFDAATGDLHLQDLANVSIENTAEYSSQVSTDIDGEIRDPLNPDPGADEINYTRTLSGHIQYYTSQSPLPLVTVILKSQDGLALDSVISDAAGFYQFSGLTPGLYQLQAHSNTQWKGGNSLDALIICKYFVNLATLQGMPLLAADVNDDQSINIPDALLVAKRHVGQISSFTKGDWIFEQAAIDLSVSNQDINLHGICTGDVNGSAY